MLHKSKMGEACNEQTAIQLYNVNSVNVLNWDKAYVVETTSVKSRMRRGIRYLKYATNYMKQ